MGVIAKWNGHKFQISASVMRGFTQLQVKGACETTETTASGEKYVTRKNTQPAEIGLTAHLNAFLGCDVRKEAMAFVDEARAGKSDFFYVYQKKQYVKIFKIKMMLVSADVSKVEIAPAGTWASADVALGLKACAVSEGASAGAATGGGGTGGAGTGTGYSKQSVASTKPRPGPVGRAMVINGEMVIARVTAANQANLRNKQKATASTVAAKQKTVQQTRAAKIQPMQKALVN